MERYNSDAAFERALAALWDHWSRLLDGYQVSSGDEKLDRMVNIWNQYQPLTKKGNLAVGSGFNDDPLWLIAGTDAYLRETGDWTILDAPTFGEGKNSWLTGTAAWTFVSISQAILGVQPTLDGLAVAPCIPAGWAGYTVKRRYRGAVYRITVENPHHAEKGIVSLTVNGTPVTGNVLPPGRTRYRGAGTRGHGLSAIITTHPPRRYTARGMCCYFEKEYTVQCRYTSPRRSSGWGKSG